MKYSSLKDPFLSYVVMNIVKDPWKKVFIVHTHDVRAYIPNTSFLLYLISGTNKLECLSLIYLSSLV
jgi:hypothetical protein